MISFIIPSPIDEAGPDFEVGPRVTIYQAAMICTGRHPHEAFLRDGTVADYLKFLKAGVRPEAKDARRAASRRSWDIYCELMRRIEAGQIKPARCESQLSGEVDPVRTFIWLDDLIHLVKEREELREYKAPAAIEAMVVPQSEVPSASCTDADAAPTKAPNKVKQKTGPQPRTFDRVKCAMQEDIKAGKHTIESLKTEKQEVLASVYRASRSTVCKARDAVLLELSSAGMPTNSNKH